jgi:hypothetical protein
LNYYVKRLSLCLKNVLVKCGHVDPAVSPPVRLAVDGIALNFEPPFNGIK